MFSSDSLKAIELFEKFNKEENNKKCLDYHEKIVIDDKEATEIIKNKANILNLIDLQNFQKEKRNEIIKQLKAEGLSIRQISRLTGISFGIIRGT
jgi:uncharacterized protein (UPF0128 family)